MTLLLRASRVASRMTPDTTLARGAERGGASGSKPIIIINKQARASRQVHIGYCTRAAPPLMTAACATDEAPTRHTRTDVQRRESDDLSTGTGSENSMDKTLTMARSADSSSGAGARALARRPSNRRQNTSFFRVRVVFRARQHRCCRRGKRVNLRQVRAVRVSSIYIEFLIKIRTHWH